MQDGFPRAEEVSDLTTPTVKSFIRETLYFYLAISESAMSGALVWEDEDV